MSDRFIIVSFPRFAGGKFISNCLSLSRHCCPQDLQSATYLLDHPTDYQYRFDSIMKTLPPTQSQMINWIDQFEFGDRQLYGDVAATWQVGIPCPPSELIDKLLARNFRLFLTSHGGDISITNLLKAWPNSTIVQLINHVKFSTISKKLKSDNVKPLEYYAGNYCQTKYQELSGPSWPSWHEFESVGYDIRNLPEYAHVSEEILDFYNWRGIDNKTFLFDVDNSIFDQGKFLSAVERLYTQLEFDDFDSNLVRRFWQSYMELHVDNVDLL